MPNTKYLLLSSASGLAWGMLALGLGYGAFRGAIWGGLIASPVIGLLIGMVTLRWRLASTAYRAILALLTLYVAGTCFGLSVGLYDWLARGVPNRIPHAVVLQAILAVWWGLTFTGYFVVLWPLAYFNHWILGRTGAADQPTTPCR